ncbi:hypothetical protein NL676_017477 [Syzygium grande]|nr:hypothetical protein NL676_017477 [Syzygium grande]
MARFGSAPSTSAPPPAVGFFPKVAAGFACLPSLLVTVALVPTRSSCRHSSAYFAPVALASLPPWISKSRGRGFLRLLRAGEGRACRLESNWPGRQGARLTEGRERSPGQATGVRWPLKWLWP